MKATELMERSFSENQLAVIKATIKHGLWGDGSHEMASGETKEAWGFCTEDAKKGIIELHPGQIGGIFSGIVKVIREKKFDFMNHVTDYWETGKTSDGMLFIAEDVVDEVKEWAKR